MSLLALDVSTKTGWCIFEGTMPVKYGLLEKDLPWSVLPYPKNFVTIAKNMAVEMLRLVRNNPKITTVVVEETNKTGRFGSRHSQKILEFIHMEFNRQMLAEFPGIDVRYVNTSDWRKTLKLSVVETKKTAKPFLKQLEVMKKKLATQTDKKTKHELIQKIKDFTQVLKKRCIHGKIDKKSISVAYVNATFDLAFKKGDNDITDAICLGKAFCEGAKFLTNQDIFENKNEQN